MRMHKNIKNRNGRKGFGCMTTQICCGNLILISRFFHFQGVCIKDSIYLFTFLDPIVVGLLLDCCSLFPFKKKNPKPSRYTFTRTKNLQKCLHRQVLTRQQYRFSTWAWYLLLSRPPIALKLTNLKT